VTSYSPHVSPADSGYRERPEGVHRPDPIRVGDWCPCGGGHFVVTDEQQRNCGAHARPVFVWPEDEDDAAMVRAALGVE
jgi:hypothetical protein